MALVWITEALNTAIEDVVDLASPGRHPLAGRAKDVAAGSVLVAIAAVGDLSGSSSSDRGSGPCCRSRVAVATAGVD